MDKMKKIIAALSTDQLKEIAGKTYDDPRDLASIVFEMVLIELERRMPAEEFVAFCVEMD